MKYLQLIQGDCAEVLPTLEDLSVDMILVDIPYAEVNRQSSGLRELDKGKADEITFDLDNVLSECVRIVKGSVYVFCGFEQISPIRKFLASSGLSTRLCIWEKTNPSPMNGDRIWLSGVEACVFGRKPNATFNRHCKNTVFRFPSGSSKIHPTEKPVPLLEELITASSDAGDLVLDFTMGSGSTGEACLKNGRRFIGVELDQGYFEKARERLENFKARRIDLLDDDSDEDVSEPDAVSLSDLLGLNLEEL
jgi:site-specific DNA-methyltransferase (adenine-specific)